MCTQVHAHNVYLRCVYVRYTEKMPDPRVSISACCEFLLKDNSIRHPEPETVQYSSYNQNTVEQPVLLGWGRAAVVQEASGWRSHEVLCKQYNARVAGHRWLVKYAGSE